MAGFGFSPTDIIAFGKFTAKITTALKEEGGSKTEYQLAIRSCEGLQAVLKEIEQLELSNISNSFGNDLKRYSSDAAILVKSFNTTIQRYDKAMGQTSSKGAHHGTGRKVQWALTAAGDLDRFRQKLSSQLDTLKLLMQSRILMIVDELQNKSDNTAPVSSILTSPDRQVVKAKGPPVFPMHTLGKLSQIADEDNFDIMGDIERLAELLYKFLATRETRNFSVRGRIRTLPQDEQTLISSKQVLSSGNTGPNELTASGIEERSAEEASAFISEESNKGDSQWVDDTNEILRSLNLTEVSREEAANIRQSGPLPPLLLTDIEEPPKQTNSSKSNDAKDSQQFEQNNRSHHKPRRFQKFDGIFGGSGLDLLSGIGLAASTLAMVDFYFNAAILAYQVLNRTDSQPGAIKILADRSMQFASLLKMISDLFNTSMSSALQDTAVEILKESNDIGKMIDSILAPYSPDNNSPVRRLRSSVLWRRDEKRINSALEQLESLKTTISLVFQIQQVRNTAKDSARAEHNLVSFGGSKYKMVKP